MKKIKRIRAGYYSVLNGGTLIAHISKIAYPVVPRADEHWALLYVSGRIERYDTKAEAVDGAHLI